MYRIRNNFQDGIQYYSNFPKTFKSAFIQNFKTKTYSNDFKTSTKKCQLNFLTSMKKVSEKLERKKFKFQVFVNFKQKFTCLTRNNFC